MKAVVHIIEAEEGDFREGLDLAWTYRPKRARGLLDKTHFAAMNDHSDDPDEWDYHALGRRDWPRPEWLCEVPTDNFIGSERWEFDEQRIDWPRGILIATRLSRKRARPTTPHPELLKRLKLVAKDYPRTPKDRSRTPIVMRNVVAGVHFCAAEISAIIRQSASGPSAALADTLTAAPSVHARNRRARVAELVDEIGSWPAEQMVATFGPQTRWSNEVWRYIKAESEKCAGPPVTDSTWRRYGREAVARFRENQPRLNPPS